MRFRALLPVIFTYVACASSDFDAPSIDRTTDPPTNARPAWPTDMPKDGTIPLLLTADGGAGADVVVSFGLPFPQTTLASEMDVTVLDDKGAPIPITTRVLARWPQDDSIRSVLVAFHASLAAGAQATWSVAYGKPTASPPAGPLEPNPDGPISATLPAAHYAKSQVGGIILPRAENVRFAQYEKEIEIGWAAFDVNSYGVDCNNETNHRTYYDGPHAQYQRFLRTGDPAHLRFARREARFFRDNELTWYADHTIAIQKCELPQWTPSRALDWGTLRKMLSQGMLDDYLVTGDAAAREAVIAMGEAYRVNLPALTQKDDPIIEITERNLGWTLMGMTSYYALDRRNEVRDAMKSLVQRAVAWQTRSESGGLEHDIERPDPDECGRGPEGASPFMTSLVVDGVMEYWLLTSDVATVSPFVQKLAAWYERDAITTDKKAFRYLWNCRTEPYDDSSTADLNLLIDHVFGAAYALTNDTHWLTLGDSMADIGIDAAFTKRPKQWDQSVRSFGKYLGYRSRGATP